MKKMKMKKLGYVIANDEEEYLNSYCIKPDSISRAWSPLCSYAKVFQTKTHAQKVIQRLDVLVQLWVLELYENERHLIVTTEQENVPKWLVQI
jgi:hypothetical protein